jgi:peptidoglycan/xylan/chitin deacetylase (PgdA/CDA1 family)
VRALDRVWEVRATFDDAYRSAAGVLPALRELGVPSQLFVCTRYARDGAPLAIAELQGDEPAELATMDWDTLRLHAEEGVAIGSHTVSHPHLPRLSDTELRRELSDSKAEIEAQLGRACTELAYPYGEHNERVRAAARAAGYDCAFSLWGGRRGDPYAVRRLDLYRRHTPLRALLMTTPLHRLVA